MDAAARAVTSVLMSAAPGSEVGMKGARRADVRNSIKRHDGNQRMTSCHDAWRLRVLRRGLINQLGAAQSSSTNTFGRLSVWAVWVKASDVQLKVAL